MAGPTGNISINNLLLISFNDKIFYPPLKHQSIKGNFTQPKADFRDLPLFRRRRPAAVWRSVGWSSPSPTCASERDRVSAKQV